MLTLTRIRKKMYFHKSVGSVLGPLLFLIYINVISNSSGKLKFYSFADDTNLLYADKNLKSIESTANAKFLGSIIG